MKKKKILACIIFAFLLIVFCTGKVTAAPDISGAISAMNPLEDGKNAADARWNWPSDKCSNWYHTDSWYWNCFNNDYNARN